MMEFQPGWRLVEGVWYVSMPFERAVRSLANGEPVSVVDSRGSESWQVVTGFVEGSAGEYGVLCKVRNAPTPTK